jgi:uncharacterized protein
VTELHISRDLGLPLDAITETFAILAKRGAGKSNAAVVMAEEMYDAGLPWVAIDPKGDWWGVRAAGDGKNPGLEVVVFGGQHGDVPLEPTAGRLVADLIVESRITCVLDVSEMSKADQRRFLVDFAERLYKANTEPLHVFCEEADEYIPQLVRGEMARLVGAFETLVKRGRTHGLGVTLITQRSASLNKDVLTQIETLIPMRTPSPQDRKAILAWVDVHDAGRDAVDALPGLASGEAFVFSPQWLDTLVRIKFRRRRTFDSGATPRVGQKVRPPATLADVDLAAIKEQMAETIERAKADDPKELRRRITGLERELAAERTRQPDRETIEVPVLAPGDLDLLHDVLDDFAVAERAVTAASAPIVKALTRLGDWSQTWDGIEERLPRLEAARERRSSRADGDVTVQLPTVSVLDARTPAPRPAARADGGERPAIGKGERQILIAIASYDNGVTPEQLTVLTGYKRSSRNTYLQRLTSAGYVNKVAERLTATDAGIDALGDDYEPLPTGVALRDYWLHRLRTGGEAVILDALIAAYPNSLTGEEIDERTGYKRSSRNTYLQRLRARELITSAGNNSTASTLLFD